MAEEYEEDYEEVQAEEVEVSDKPAPPKSDNPIPIETPIKEKSAETAKEEKLPVAKKTPAPLPKKPPIGKANHLKRRSSVDNGTPQSERAMQKGLTPAHSNAAINQSYSKPFENTTASRLKYKKGVSHIEHELELCKETHAKLLEDTDSLINNMTDDDKRMIFLRNENKSVREELKRLNKLLTELVEFRRAMLKKKPMTARGPKPEVNAQEARNLEKMLNNLENEHKKVSGRLEEISNPQYLVDLKERIIALDLKIKKAGKNKKNLEVEQLLREKKIDKVIDVGEPEYAQEIGHIKTESNILDKKIRELDEALNRNSSTIEEIKQKTEEVKNQYKKLQETAEKEGINENINATAKTHDLDVKYRALQSAKESLTKTINLLKTRYTVTLGDYIQKKGNLQKNVSTAAVNVQSKNDAWLKTQKELQELVKKMKGACEGIIEEINKKYENPQPIKSAHPEHQNKAVNASPNEIQLEETIHEEQDIKLAVDAQKLREKNCAKKIQREWKSYKNGKSKNKVANNLPAKKVEQEKPIEPKSAENIKKTNEPEQPAPIALLKPNFKPKNKKKFDFPKDPNNKGESNSSSVANLNNAESVEVKKEADLPKKVEEPIKENKVDKIQIEENKKEPEAKTSEPPKKVFNFNKINEEKKSVNQNNENPLPSEQAKPSEPQAVKPLPEAPKPIAKPEPQPAAKPEEVTLVKTEQIKDIPDAETKKEIDPLEELFAKKSNQPPAKVQPKPEPVKEAPASPDPLEKLFASKPQSKQKPIAPAAPVDPLEEMFKSKPKEPVKNSLSKEPVQKSEAKKSIAAALDALEEL